MRRQRILGPDDSRAPTRRKAHGLTVDEQDDLRARQGGVCGICGLPGELQIDHDHRHCPGRYGCPRCVRGLLCPRCNGLLGQFGDGILPRVVAYLVRGPR